MPVDLIQDGAVTLVAIAAATLIFRRVVGATRKTASPKCSNCASSCETPAAEARKDETVTHPLVVVRRQSR